MVMPFCSRSRARGPCSRMVVRDFAHVGDGGVVPDRASRASPAVDSRSAPPGPTISHSFGPSQRQARSPVGVKRLASAGMAQAGGALHRGDEGGIAAVAAQIELHPMGTFAQAEVGVAKLRRRPWGAARDG